MSEEKFTLNIQGLIDSLAPTLFAERLDIVRELLTNAADACILRKAQDPAYTSPLVSVDTDSSEAILSVADNGVGMTEDYLREYFATLGASSKPPNTRVSAVVGGFGLGVLAYFMGAARIEITTKSLISGSPALRWYFAGSNSYRLGRLPDAPVGTKVVLYLKTNYADLASQPVIIDAVRRLWQQPDIPVSVNGQLIAQPGHIVASDPDAAEHGDKPKVSFANQAIMRLEVAGSWALSDFATWLNQLESVYMRLSLSLVASEPEIWQVATRPFTATLLTVERAEFALAMRMVRTRVHELRLHRIQIASPGFVELIGSLNPMKVMVDFITNLGRLVNQYMIKDAILAQARFWPISGCPTTRQKRDLPRRRSLCTPLTSCVTKKELKANTKVSVRPHRVNLLSDVNASWGCESCRFSAFSYPRARARPVL